MHRCFFLPFYLCVCVCVCVRHRCTDTQHPSMLLLLQFSSWVDAVILVFSLENEASFQELYQIYSQLGAFRSDIPVIVVGTQGDKSAMHL